MNFNFVLANFHLARFYLGRFDLFYNLSIIKISLNGVGVDEGGDLYKNKSSISPNFYTGGRKKSTFFILQGLFFVIRILPAVRGHKVPLDLSLDDF